VNNLAIKIAEDTRIAYALMFGSRARASHHEGSDLDIAIGLERGAALSAEEWGSLAADLELASGLPVDLVLVDDTPPALAYRIFTEGQVLSERNRQAFVERKARAILEYLDFAPFEAQCAKGALAVAARGR
jgi:uncharacterized protein